MKPYLRLSSIIFLLALASCSNPYKYLTKQETVSRTALRFKPIFQKELYRCLVDGRFLLKKFHLSGLLLFKKMEDGSTRVVFQNEMGISFFDFEWSKQNVFKVNQIIPQLNKPAVVKTLQKDIQLLLMISLDGKSEQQFIQKDLSYNRFSLDKGVAYYISNGEKLIRIENAGKRKVTTIEIDDKKTITSMPEKTVFKHHKANFTIQLNKIEQDVNE